MKKSVMCLMFALSVSILTSFQAKADECRNQNRYYVGYFSCQGNSKVNYSVRLLTMSDEDKTCPAASPINTPSFAVVSIIDKATQQIVTEIKLAEGQYQMTDKGGMKAQFQAPSVKLKLNCETLPGGGFSIGN